MQPLKKTWFISDLHLDASEPGITSQFIALLDACDASVDNVYILGDLFEAWIGDDDTTPPRAEIIQHLKVATQRGVKIHFMRGNRDFLVGEKFQRETGCQLLQDEVKINLYGTPVLIMHGDTLCTQDASYNRARKFLRNRILQKIFLMLPFSMRSKIAAGARDASKKHTSMAAEEIMDVTQNEVERVMDAHQVNHLIHGHTHRPAIHHFIKQQDMTRIVLPAWHHGGSVLSWSEDGNKQFIDVSLLNSQN